MLAGRHGGAPSVPVNRYSVCHASFESVWAVPEKLRDVVRIEVRARLDGAGDRDGRGVDAVLPDAGGNQRLRRAQGGLSHREARQRGHWIVGEAAAGDQQGAAAELPAGRARLPVQRRRHRGHRRRRRFAAAGRWCRGSRLDRARRRCTPRHLGPARALQDPFERLAKAGQILDIEQRSRLSRGRRLRSSAASSFERSTAGDERCCGSPTRHEAPTPRRRRLLVRLRSAGDAGGQQAWARSTSARRAFDGRDRPTPSTKRRRHRRGDPAAPGRGTPQVHARTSHSLRLKQLLVGNAPILVRLGAPKPAWRR